MALLFAEHGVTVSLNDPSEENMNQLLATAEEEGLQDRMKKCGSYEDLCESLGSPKVFFFSLPHGTVGDSVVDGLRPYLEKGDIIIDASNENAENTQRRQGKLVAQYVQWDVLPIFCAPLISVEDACWEVNIIPHDHADLMNLNRDVYYIGIELLARHI